MRKTGYFAAAAAVALAVLALTAKGCGTIESEEVKTGSIWARFMVDHHPDDQVVAWAIFRHGGPTGRIVDLTGGEYVECNGTRLDEYYDPFSGYRWHRSYVALDPNGRYLFNFVRLDETVDTELNVGEPPLITGTDPVGSMRVSDSLTIYWDTTYPGDAVRIDLEGDCIGNVTASNLPDNGEYTIEYVNPIGVEDCVCTATVTRALLGLVNFDFLGGLTEANRKDSVTLIFQRP